jgi:RNA polymerase sigma factor FliA
MVAIRDAIKKIPPNLEMEENQFLEMHKGWLWSLFISIRNSKYVQAIEREGIINAGRMRFLEKRQEYDPTRGTSLCQFSVRAVKGAMIDEMRRIGYIDRIEERRKINQAISLDASIDQIGKHDGLNRFKVNPEIEKALMRKKQRNPIWDDYEEAQKMLSETEKEILALFVEKQMKQREIGEELGVSESRISQILTNIKKYLRGLQICR